jgi:hypothetical protein
MFGLVVHPAPGETMAATTHGNNGWLIFDIELYVYAFRLKYMQISRTLSYKMCRGEWGKMKHGAKWNIQNSAWKGSRKKSTKIYRNTYKMCTLVLQNHIILNRSILAHTWRKSGIRAPHLERHKSHEKKEKLQIVHWGWEMKKVQNIYIYTKSSPQQTKKFSLFWIKCR